MYMQEEIKTILRVQLCRTVVSLSMPSKGSSRLIEDKLNPMDNLEEFNSITDEELDAYKKK